MENNSEYVKIKEKVLNVIEQKKIVNIKETEELNKLKEEKLIELDKYNDIGYSDVLEYKKQLVIEQYNDLILKKEVRIQTNDLYSNRIRSFLHLMYFRYSNNKEAEIDAINELEYNIEEELVSYYNNQIKIIKQKDQIYKLENIYIEVLKKSNENREYEHILSTEEIKEELIREEQLEKEKKIAEDSFGGVNIQICSDKIDEIDMLDENVVRFSKAIHPEFENRIISIDQK